MQKLIEIQKELKAPKGQHNSFGNYNYRSAEDILEAVKPLLVKHGCQLTLSDELVQVGERYYVKATATFTEDDNHSSTFVTAYAREAKDKKGMDDSQITGTASSYARKYALNGLFLIDDTKDADTDEYKKQSEKQSQKAEPDYASETITARAAKNLKDLVEQNGFTVDQVLTMYEVEKLEDLTKAQYADAVKRATPKDKNVIKA